MSDIKKELGEEEQGMIEIYSLLVEDNYPDFGDDAIEREVKDLIRTINRQNLHNIQKEYEFKIRAATDSEEKIVLLNQYNEILKLTTKIN